MKSFHLQNLEAIPSFVQEILPQVKSLKNILFYGEMGSGKTTLIKAICKALESQDEVSSPTYAIVNEYTIPNNKIYHFDLYRLQSKEEILDIGFEDYLNEDRICFMEWPQLVEEWIESGLKIEIKKIDLDQRKISIFKI